MNKCIKCGNDATWRYGHYFFCSCSNNIEAERYVGAYRPEPNPAAIEQANKKYENENISKYSSAYKKERWA